MSTQALREEDAELHRYYDGELDLLGSDDAEKRFAADEEATRELERLERLSEAMQLAFEDEAAELDSDALFAAIREGVNRVQSSPPPALRAIDGGALDIPSQPPGGRDAESARRAMGLTFGVLALAAAALLIFVVAGGDLGVARLKPSGKQPEAIVEVQPEVVVDPPPGSEVISVDFGESTGTVFAVEGEQGQPLAVVWINDEGGEP